MIGVHKTHCCIDHGCKYGEEDCPVVIGLVKQDDLCEMCGLDIEDCDDYKRAIDEQTEYLIYLWEEKQNPRKLSPLESGIAEIAKRHGRIEMLTMLQEINAIPFVDITVPKVIEILKTLKEK